jgi:pulcherriminic acid synthase
MPAAHHEGDSSISHDCHSPPTPLVIPEIRLPFAAPAPRTDRDQLRTHALAWAQRYGLIGRRGAHRLSTTTLLDLGMALCGQAPTHRARILVCWYLWALILDDRIDDGPWAEDGELDRFIDAVQAVTENDCADPSVETSRFDDPMLVALAEDLWPQTRSWGNEQWRQRLVLHLMRHLRAQATLVQMREPDTELSLVEYLPLRRDSFGALFFFDLIDAAESLDPYKHPANTEWWNTLRKRGADIIAWTNDIHSVAKDVVCGERFNLVSLMTDTEDVDWPAAIESAHQMVDMAVEEFNAIAARYAGRSACAATDPNRLRQIVRAAGDWHRSVSRYHQSPQDASSFSAERMSTLAEPPESDTPTSLD